MRPEVLFLLILVNLEKQGGSCKLWTAFEVKSEEKYERRTLSLGLRVLKAKEKWKSFEAFSKILFQTIPLRMYIGSLW